MKSTVNSLPRERILPGRESHHISVVVWDAGTAATTYSPDALVRTPDSLVG
jgi:hypothetical protein